MRRELFAAVLLAALLLTALANLRATDRLADELLESIAQIESAAANAESARALADLEAAYARWTREARRCGMAFQQPQLDGINEAFVSLFEALSAGEDAAAACRLLRIRLETLRRLEHPLPESLF